MNIRVSIIVMMKPQKVNNVVELNEGFRFHEREHNVPRHVTGVGIALVVERISFIIRLGMVVTIELSSISSIRGVVTMREGFHVDDLNFDRRVVVDLFYRHVFNIHLDTDL